MTRVDAAKKCSFINIFPLYVYVLVSCFKVSVDSSFFPSGLNQGRNFTFYTGKTATHPHKLSSQWSFIGKTTDFRRPERK